jgi:hypothetical protein
MSTSIPISELNLVGAVTSNDYVPIVQDASITTFRTQLSTVGHWISSSVAASSSVSSISSSWSLTSSFAQVGGASSTAINLIYPNTSTASYAISASHALRADNARSSSTAISASWAPVQNSTGTTNSASWASASIWATSSSFASGSRFSVSASWASQSLTSNVSVSSSFASNSIHSNTADTASYVISSANDGIVYPYIQEVNFWARHDDWIDINLANLLWGSPGNGMCIGYGNSGTYYHRMYWDNANKVYTGGDAYGTVNCSPIQNLVMFADNRGGGPYYWYIYYGRFDVYFATSATTGISHSYAAGGGSYGGYNMAISALRAISGMSAVTNYYGTSSVFPSFSSSFNG